MATLIQGGTIVTGNRKREWYDGDLLIEKNLISHMGKGLVAPRGCSIVDARGRFVIPGLVQAHIHLCQTMFRGEADDLSLIDWLKKRIWPMESAHTESSLKASAQLGLLELAKSGTTSLLDMGTVKHTNSLLEAAHESGLRYWGGKCFMDVKERSGPLYEETKVSLTETADLIKAWKNISPLMEYVLCPRFAISCSEKLLRTLAELQSESKLKVHIHASESLEEIALVKRLTKKDNVEFLHSLGLLNSKTAIAHAVHLQSKEIRQLAKTKTPIVHCPSSNLKLASGIAPLETYLKAKVKVGLGADGAPCNNGLDGFKEMHLAALLQKPGFGPKALPAHIAFELATMGGAQVLEMEDKIGSLEVGKFADVVLVDRSHPSVYTVPDPFSALVYSCNGRDVTDVMVNGQWIIRNRVSLVLDEEPVKAFALKEKKKLLSRI